MVPLCNQSTFLFTEIIWEKAENLFRKQGQELRGIKRCPLMVKALVKKRSPVFTSAWPSSIHSFHSVVGYTAVNINFGSFWFIQEAMMTTPKEALWKTLENLTNDQFKNFKWFLNKDMEMFLIKAELNRVQQFAVDVTLDPDTAHPNLILSNDRKQVHCGDREQNLPKNPERFVTLNALGKQSFSSRSFYYEVQVEGKTSWDLGVAKESINRKENVKVNPENGFWAICLRKGGKYRASAIHLSVKIQPRKVGVFVDYEKRSVSFYNAESAELFHCYTDCSFSEKLYPFISPGTYHGGQNSTPKIHCSVHPSIYPARIEELGSWNFFQRTLLAFVPDLPVMFSQSRRPAPQPTVCLYCCYSCVIETRGSHKSLKVLL
uniref:B30.2/SPRY domain-containing protein n=1 Tax=Amphilophus citrinellus TaxID=61819 RepID=A0A3Q0S6V1_AMPCI